jgi:pimeloyl-ACP methyl ester carboxylesterase
MKQGLATLGGITGRGRVSKIREVGRECIAFARQATLLHRDMTATYPRLAEPGDDVVVFLHGLFATAGVLRPMREAVERETGAHTASFSYAPGPGVAAVADALAELVDRLPASVHVHLVGHSMGGVAARWFVQELGGDPRVVQSVSLASPFRGTRRARLFPTAAGRDIRPDSSVLERLRERGDCGVPHLSIVAAADSLVTEHAALDHGERVVIDGCGHNGVLYNRRAIDLVVSRVLRR